MGGYGLRCMRSYRAWRNALVTAMFAWLLLTVPAVGMAKHYRFEDGAYLGAAHLMPDWADMLNRYEQQKPDFQKCLTDADACEKRFAGVQRLLSRARDLDSDKQIRLVNRYVNKRRYRRDRAAQLDTPLRDEPQKYRSRWSTPLEFFRRGGDCEDFASTKYFLLRELGFSADELRVVVLYDRRASGYHAIVAVDRDDGVWLLESDNNIFKRRHLDYRYIYSLNEHSVWDYENPAPKQAVSSAAENVTTQPVPTEATL